MCVCIQNLDKRRLQMVAEPTSCSLSTLLSIPSLLAIHLSALQVYTAVKTTESSKFIDLRNLALTESAKGNV